MRIAPKIAGHDDPKLALRSTTLTLGLLAVLTIGAVPGADGISLAARQASAAPAAIDQLQPALAYNPTQDEYMLVWSEDRGSGLDLYAKSLFSNGLGKGGPGTRGNLLISDVDARGQPKPHGPRTAPTVLYNAAAAADEYFVVWSEQRGEADGFDIYGMRIGTSGKARGAPRLLAGGVGDQGSPTIAYSPQREMYLVAFDDNTADVDQIRGVRVRQNGIVVGDAFDLVRTAFDTGNPTLQGRGDGYLLVWVDARNGNHDLFGRLLNDNGLPVGGARGIDTALRESMEDELAPALEPYSGQLVYNQYDPATGLDVLGFQVEGNGRANRRNIGIVVPVADQADPTLASNSARGEVLVAYADNRSGQFDIYAVRLRSGLPRGADFPVVADGFVP